MSAEHTEADLLRDLGAIEAWALVARSEHAAGDRSKTAAALYMISVLSTRWTGMNTEQAGDGKEQGDGG